MQEIMNSTDIAFPNLGIYLKDVPKGFYIGDFFIAYYGVIIGLGILAGILMAVHTAKRTGFDTEVIWDFAIYAIIFSIIGARTYYIVFEWDKYKDDLLRIFNIRQGGMAIYGAVIGAFVTLFVYCKIKKVKPFQIGDAGVMGLILGQVIGRWGNFINREVFGEYSDGLFAMRLPIEAVRSRDISENLQAHILEGTNYIQVHPTFLYESALNLCLLIFMYMYIKHRKFYGEICLLYLGGYGIIRFFIEGIRTDQLKIGNTGIAVSQMLGIVLFVASAVIDIAVRVYLAKRPAVRLAEPGGVPVAEDVSAPDETPAAEEVTEQKEAMASEKTAEQTAEPEKGIKS